MVEEKNSLDYYREKWAYFGSTAYYTHLYLPKTAKEPLEVLFLLNHEWQAVPRECQDPEVAYQKLSWWQSEIEHFYQKSPQHPLTQNLAQFEHFNLPKQYLQGLIQAAMLEIQLPEFETHNDQQLFFNYKYGLWEKICAHLLGGEPIAHENLYEKLASYKGQIAALNEYSSEQKEVNNYFCNETLQPYQLTVHDLKYQAFDKKALQSFIKHNLSQMKVLEAELKESFKNSPKWMQANRLSFELSKKTLKTIAKMTPTQIHQTHIDLSPMKKLWTAWLFKKRF